jgi:hypothetical protein
MTVTFSKVFTKSPKGGGEGMMKIVEIDKYVVNDRYASLNQKFAKVRGIKSEVCKLGKNISQPMNFLILLQLQFDPVFVVSVKICHSVKEITNNLRGLRISFRVS